ncbi:MAG: site-specific integrase [Proteobacteria bacterium]|nr:site-specific integrase [Pseudomonadota bacterium]
MISEYKDEHGNLLYKVSINLRGRNNPQLRYRRKLFGLKSLEEAKAAESKLYRYCEKRMANRELTGQRLLTIIDKWVEHTIRTKVVTGEIGEKLLLDYRGLLLKWLKPHLLTAASMITSYMMTEIIRQMKLESISQSYMKKFRFILRSVYEYGLAYKLIPKGTPIPTPEIKLNRLDETAPEVLNNNEILKLVSEAFERQHPWRHVWAMALLTGMRSGELRALRWHDVDFDNRLIRISRSFESRTKTIKSTKAGYWRDLPISDELKRLLDEVRVITPQSEFVLPELYEWQVNRQALNLRNFCNEIGIPSVKFHTLRACFATQLLRQGVEAAKVMKVCGWRDLSTMQRYVRLAGIEVVGVTDKISVLPPLDPSKKVVSIRGIS